MRRVFTRAVALFIVLVGISSNVFADGRITTAFRVTDLEIKSPHILGSAFYDLFWIDATDSINDEIYWNIREDSPKPDGYSDISILYHFKNGMLKANEGLCRHGSSWNTFCEPSEKADNYVSRVMRLTNDPFGMYDYVTSPQNISIDIIGVKVKAEYGQMIFSFDRETNSIQGKFFCFLSLAKAKEHRMPYWLSYVGDKTLDVVLRKSDLSEGLKGESGWWFHLDFVAKPVSYLNRASCINPIE